MTYKDDILAIPNVLGYFPLDDPVDATFVTDASGNGNHSTNAWMLKGEPTVVQNGGYSAYFDGIDDHAQWTGQTFAFSGSSYFTVMGWLFANPTQPNDYPTIISKAQYGVGGWDFYIRRSDRRLCFTRITSGGSSVTVVSNRQISWATWHHFAFRYNGSGLQLFVDRQVDAYVASTAACGSTTTPLTFGRYSYLGDDAYAGNLDEVIIANTALNSIYVYEAYDAAFRKYARPRFFAGFM